MSATVEKALLAAVETVQCERRYLESRGRGNAALAVAEVRVTDALGHVRAGEYQAALIVLARALVELTS